MRRCGLAYPRSVRQVARSIGVRTVKQLRLLFVAEITIRAGENAAADRLHEHQPRRTSHGTGEPAGPSSQVTW
jgi:hypothetical protein